MKTPGASVKAIRVEIQRTIQRQLGCKSEHTTVSGFHGIIWKEQIGAVWEAVRNSVAQHPEEDPRVISYPADKEVHVRQVFFFDRLVLVKNLPIEQSCQQNAVFENEGIIRASIVRPTGHWRIEARETTPAGTP